MIDDQFLIASSKHRSKPSTPRTPRTPRSMYAWLHVGVDSHREAYPISPSPRAGCRTKCSEGTGSAWLPEDAAPKAATPEKITEKSFESGGKSISAPSPRALMQSPRSKMFSWLQMDVTHIPASPRNLAARSSRHARSLDFSQGKENSSLSKTNSASEEGLSSGQPPATEGDAHAQVGGTHQSCADPDAQMPPLTIERNVWHFPSPPLDPQVNPGMLNQGCIASHVPATNLLAVSRTSSAHSSESRPEQREVAVDCYWLPELNQGSNIGDFADWIVQPAEEGSKSPCSSGTTRTPRALSPVLIPEMANSFNLVCVSDLVLNSPEKLATETFSSGTRYLF